MSYCRFGPDSDVYCYKNVFGGYTVIVATFKQNLEELIGLPHDGETFNVKTLKELKAKLNHLKKLGYLVPDAAFQRIKRELKHPVQYSSRSSHKNK